MSELEIYKYIGHRLPKVSRVSGIVNRILKPIYNRKNRDLVISDVFGYNMQLDSRQCVDGNLLFCPQLYDHVEISFLLNNLSTNDWFLDVGSHIGFYSLMASKRTDNVLAIEASSKTYERLKKNIALNNLKIKALNNGVSDRTEILKLSNNSDTNSGGHSFINKQSTGEEVQCKALKDILEIQDIKSVKIMKIDVEGFEYKILKHFLENSEKSLYPKFIITEFFESEVINTSGNQIELLETYGYKQIKKTTYNRILEYL